VVWCIVVEATVVGLHLNIRTNGSGHHITS
jgi:hypothetical protein